VPVYKDASHLPIQLWIVRHGESAGNVANDRAMLSGAARIDIEGRDVDVPLSSLGENQSDALGKWFSEMPMRADAIFASPYRRARDTALRILQAGGVAGNLDSVMLDERLREKEFGILDGLTKTGIEIDFPQQAAYRALLGKFYHRPPGGESWCDVILRLRSMLDTLALHYAGKRVLIVTHQVVVLCLRYLLEDMDEHEILQIDHAGEVANCAVTEYRRSSLENGKHGFVLRRYNYVTPLKKEGTPVTASPDSKAAAP
jgi:probable phosphoglycerate mutase